MFKYRLVFLPHDNTALLANLDELSIQGWDFVAWNGDWFPTTTACDYQRQALIRQPDNGDERQ